MDETLAPPPRLLASTAHGFCAASPPPYPLDFQYSLVPRGCPGGETRTFAAPWCHRPSEPAMVYYTECAWVESYVQDNWEGPLWRVVGGSVLGGLGGNSSSPSLILADALPRDHRPAGVWPQAASTGGAPPPSLPPTSLFHSTPHLFHHPLLATPGPMRCAWCPGHFILELLPVLLLMDAILPPHVPLLWPSGTLPQSLAGALRSQGALSRTLVLQPREPTLHSVDRLLYFQSGEVGVGGVPTSWLAQRAANEKLRGMVGGGGSGGGLGGGAALTAVLALRVGATTRQLDNVEAVVGVLQREVPGVVVDAFTPGSGGGVLEDGGRFERACLLVGVHGANLANALFMRPGCTLIELGSVDMFTDYYCLARNLGLRYFVSLGEAGGHGEARFRANVTELALILRALVAEGGLQV